LVVGNPEKQIEWVRNYEAEKGQKAGPRIFKGQSDVSIGDRLLIKEKVGSVSEREIDD
jgi:hypothetical protein